METLRIEYPHLRGQVALARAVFLALALTELLEHEVWKAAPAATGFLAAYLGVAVVLVMLEFRESGSAFRLPLVADVAALAVFLALTPSVPAFWLVYLFAVFAAAVTWGVRTAVILAGGFALALLVRTAAREAAHWPHITSWIALAEGSYAAAVGIAFFGEREREHIRDHQFLDQLAAIFNPERSFSESIHELLQKIQRAFAVEQVLLAVSDDDLERVFVWTVRHDETAPSQPEEFPAVRRDDYLLDELNANLAWNSLEARGEGFGWGRDGKRLRELPQPAKFLRRAAGMRSVMSAVVESRQQPIGRIFLCHSMQEFQRADLRRLERVVMRVSPHTENLFRLRNLRARVIAGERARLSHDLHDGPLQTLLSLDIALGLLPAKVPPGANGVASELARLRGIVQRECQELRHTVRNLRPVELGSADLPSAVVEFAARFQQESGLAVAVSVREGTVALSDHTCRELFQMYREAMYNVKKHSGATQVVVRLWQEPDHVSLEVDDNGRGFSFAGRFGSDELDRLRLGPISIKERARSMNGALTVESNPGHGSRVRIDIPVC